MILSDSLLAAAIESGELIIRGYDTRHLQPASIDLHLGSHFAFWSEHGKVIDLSKSYKDFPQMEYRHVRTCELGPYSFALATTLEHIELGRQLKGQVEGRSSLGRLGLLVHSTAGFIDPGFKGQITLELFNQSPHFIRLVAGQGICQLAVEQVGGVVARAYGDPGLASKYSGQIGVTPSRWKGTNVG